MNTIKRKIRSQKKAAILLIIVPLIFFLRMIFLQKNMEYENMRTLRNTYIQCGGLMVLIICGVSGLRRSNNKLKKLK